MSFVRTVLGDVPSEELGVCYAHEHIIIDSCYVTEKTPEFLLDSVEVAVSELREFHAAGGRAMVDSMPCDSGRNVLKLAEVSRESGVHILCPTGMHLAKYYPPNHWSHHLDVDELAELFIADIEIGVDSEDYGSPIIKRTTHRAGVIKVAGSLDSLTHRETTAFKAAAKAQVQTGCPILTHTENGTAAPEQIEVLAKAGADLHHVVLSHTDRNPDVNYHRELLRTGVNLEYDSAFRWKGEDNPTRDLIVQLLPEFPSQIMLGMDAARRAYWKYYGGGPGLTYLLTEFAPDLLRDLPVELVTKMLVENPSRAYSFVCAA